jgi:HPt (histidine-containing phosphotransfer) domain-containing protein
VIERYLQTPFAPPERSARRDAAHAAAALPGVDMDYLRRLTDGNEATMRRLMGIYLQEMTLELKNLEAAVHAGDAKAIQLVAHGCKGASANYGMNAITTILQEIEIQGRDKQIGESAAALRRAQEAFQHIQSYWSSYLEGTSDPNAVKEA